MWYPSRDRRECTVCVSGRGWQEQEGHAVTLRRSGVDERNYPVGGNGSSPAIVLFSIVATLGGFGVLFAHLTF